MQTQQILVTNDYNKFKIMPGNREINENHVSFLVRSMAEKYVPVPIIVNSTYQIVDGQHRLEACRRLGIPLYYIKGDDYDLKDVQRINSANRNWNNLDVAKSYAFLGNENYKIFLDFREKYGFDKGSTVAMLCGTTSEGGNHGGRGANADFKNGNFKVKNLKYGIECAEKLYDFEKFYKGFKRRSFIMAMLHLFQNKNYEHRIMLDKLEFSSTKLVDCTDTENYMKLMESIYNFRSKDKTRFF